MLVRLPCHFAKCFVRFSDL